MAASRCCRAKRAFVSLLLALAKAYGVVVDVKRDSPDSAVQEAFRKVVLKAHPDKGGKKADAQRLQEAREEWQRARAKPCRAGRPKATDAQEADAVERVVLPTTEGKG